jgi:hypothetical protein
MPVALAVWTAAGCSVERFEALWQDHRKSGSYHEARSDKLGLHMRPCLVSAEAKTGS